MRKIVKTLIATGIATALLAGAPLVFAASQSSPAHGADQTNQALQHNGRMRNRAMDGGMMGRGMTGGGMMPMMRMMGEMNQMMETGDQMMQGQMGGDAGMMGGSTWNRGRSEPGMPMRHPASPTAHDPMIQGGTGFQQGNHHASIED